MAAMAARFEVRQDTPSLSITEQLQSFFWE